MNIGARTSHNSLFAAALGIRPAGRAPESSGRLFKLMGDLVDEDYGVRIGIARATWDEFESVALALQPKLEAAALELHAMDESLAREFLALYSNALAVKSIETPRVLIDRMSGAGNKAVTGEPVCVECEQESACARAGHKKTSSPLRKGKQRRQDLWRGSPPRFR